MSYFLNFTKEYILKDLLNIISNPFPDYIGYFPCITREESLTTKTNL